MQEREIAEIIERVQRRLATADAARPGSSLQAGAEVIAPVPETGDAVSGLFFGLHQSVRIPCNRPQSTPVEEVSAQCSSRWSAPSIRKRIALSNAGVILR